jgi:fatty acid desaturase
MLVPYCISIFAYIISYAVMFSPSLCRGYQPIPWLAALAHGWSSAMLGLYLQHDGCHASFSRSPFIWNVMRRLYELMTGLSSAVWIHQHGTPSLKTNLPCNDFFG